jgi:transposase
VARGQKKSRSQGWPIVLIDESGFMLQPVVRRTWAPRGKTPVHSSWDRHDRLSVIAGIALSPVRRRPRLYFRVYAQNIRSEQVIQFLTSLRRHLRRKFLLVLDRYSVHRKAVRVLLESHPDWLEVEWLPAYAPDLNPTERVWGHSKYGDLANFIPDDVADLHQAVTTSLEAMGSEPHLLRSFFRHAGLEI